MSQPQASAAEQVFDVLMSLDRVGGFAASDAVIDVPPTIVADGVGMLSLPVPPEQAKALMAVAARAPFGRGPNTVVDDTVRATWQLTPEQFSVDDDFHAGPFTQLLGECARALGVTGAVEGHLYRLLVYPPGGHFSPHRDTEKVPGMFATLVLVLPSAHEGGALLVHHDGETFRFVAPEATPSTLGWAGFYADCLHEVEPVSAGYRVCLVYNLALASGEVLRPPNNQEAIAKLRELTGPEELEDWSSKTVFLLAHKYSGATLSWDTLKGSDAAAAAALFEATQGTGWQVAVSMLSVTEEGFGDMTYDGGGRRGRYGGRDLSHSTDPADFEVHDVEERSVHLEGLHMPDGASLKSVKIPLTVDEDDILPEGELEELEPDEQNYYASTGNEGGTFDRTYRTAGLVLWRQDAAPSFVLSYAPESVLELVEYGAARVQGTAEACPSWVVATLGAMRTGWDRNKQEALERYLKVVHTAQNKALVLRLMERKIEQQTLSPSARTAWDACVRLLDSQELWDMHRQRIEAATLVDIDVVVTSLVAFVRTTTERSPKARDKAVARAVEVAVQLAESAASQSQRGWQEARWYSVQVLAALLELAARIEAATICDAVFARLQTLLVLHDTTRFVAPALLAAADALPLTMRHRLAPTVVVVMPQLQEWVQSPPSAPADWRRPAEVDPRCPQRATILAFLESPTEETLTVRVREDLRRSIQSALQYADVAFREVKSGSPHALILTKNSASYERAVDTWKTRKGLLERLNAVLRYT